MKLKDFDYYLPEELIAQTPLEKRDESRLLVLKRQTGEITHDVFKNLKKYLVPGDLLVVNKTRVIPARLFGVREQGGEVEILLVKRMNFREWEVLVKPGRRARVGTRLIFAPGVLEGEIVAQTEVGRIIKFSFQGVFEEILNQLGQTPLPPYIKEKLKDPERYQTIYAKEPGSAAAPTAGLHFTRELISELKDYGVEFAEVLLHVGLGTFKPVKTENILEHKMHEEYYEIENEAAEKVNKAKREGRRVIAVGTTVVRVLESVADKGQVAPAKGYTDLFIYPGFNFQIIDGLITNFHLPKSTLLMLVSAFAGREKVLNAYEIAVRLRYRFFSFGDAMLII
ncbi:tRNA preQ1(34) S-adenosylmethionine ribosyltransferase-isomerase QueA [Carboxydothermus hydrogenoformans]|uniref:S-adenosylmethionine:tRNA ribosyltransferase-isomerase n=1 Tax=Carboxydothermus hydrogenoformans (strain ATCC BAA-161 / DSM 6008 / Z-2901) TaxID=246194 RepID=QUEA_CARHZ|nr:tRNA preQ1(34) S-adenosylmethionine ribosyltransferase-isomerase QueA [Carboxydothermus hydrogenoformans]Q3ABY6.1 RecName: Full=S-adenosylmethionine:tRNA ribosyltransferase-isomerase; AltName: Full=Queuosine biosynthesis protein QueA [Carboxydothermus hydrogenoformans Z-2901]ABB15057.1 S-adenosylmethionine:tRNA ribosyltransferase-isomerase [Carboxydothermus hydrogenoformans Z-2901]